MVKRKKVLNFIGILAFVVFLLILPVLIIKERYREIGREELIEEELAVRLPIVAGSFYPAEKSDLDNQISGFLNQAVWSEKRSMILIVPHAGYQYSGQVAAYGFGQLVDSSVSRVVLLGFTHKLPFSGAAVYSAGFWQTPLGQVEVDKGLAQKIIASSELVFENQNYHQEEHSLEVEIPFLQKTLKNFKVVPILMGSQEKTLVEDLASVLAANLDSQTVLVISSDFAHYPSYEEAKKIDGATIEAILSGEVEEFEKAVADSLAAVSNLSTCACAGAAIEVGMKAARNLGINDVRLIKYANSGDTAGEKERVVGYAAIGFYSERIGDELNKEEQEELLAVARQTLETYMREEKMPEFSITHPFLEQKLGVFVTLRKKGELRGCIGRFEPEQPLWEVVREVAIDSATRDSRFLPVQPEELDEIKIEISVLSRRRKVNSAEEIALGTHGVYLQKGNRSGVFLPQVAAETGWSFEEFMGQLCSQKAGLPKNCWQDPSVDLYTFTAQIFEENI